MSIRADVIRGHTDAVILAQLLRRDSYGYEINKNIENCSAFRRLEDSGYITSYWGDEAVGARRKYYRITEKGREAYRQARAEWDASVRILNALLEGEA